MLEQETITVIWRNLIHFLSHCTETGKNVLISTLKCYRSGWVWGQVKVQSVQGDRKREWRGRGQPGEPWSSDTTAGVWRRYKDFRLQTVLNKWRRSPVNMERCPQSASKFQDQRQSGHTLCVILTCSLSPLCTRGRKPPAAGQHWLGPVWNSAGASWPPGPSDPDSRSARWPGQEREDVNEYCKFSHWKKGIEIKGWVSINRRTVFVCRPGTPSASHGVLYIILTECLIHIIYS